MPQQGAPLSPEWARFIAELDTPTRQRLYSLVRYCSARRIGPSSVDDEIFAEYWRYRGETTGLGHAQHHEALYGAGVECLRGYDRRTAVAAAH